MSRLTDAELEAIEERARGMDGQDEYWDAHLVATEDVPALIAEVRRLRDSYWARMEATGRRPLIADYEGEIRRLREGIRHHRHYHEIHGLNGQGDDHALWALLGDDDE